LQISFFSFETEFSSCRRAFCSSTRTNREEYTILFFVKFTEPRIYVVGLVSLRSRAFCSS
jgi:hypothetical protein